MPGPKPNNTKFEFDPVLHEYRWNREIVPSVTQLIQEFGLLDYSRVPPDRLEFKRLIGIRTHAASLLVDNGSLDEEHFNTHFPECVPYLEAYRKFRIIEEFEPTHKEDRHYSRKWRFAGTPDEHGIHMGVFKGAHVLVDYKCTWRMYESTGPQLAGYSMLIEENLGIKIKGRFGLLLKPTGHYELTPFKKQDDFTDFQACVHLHWQKRNKYKTTKGVYHGSDRTDD